MFSTFTFFDYPRQWQVLFQKPATTMMEGIIDLHHDIFTFLVVIIVFVSLMLLTILIRFVEQPQVSVVTPQTPFMKYRVAHGVTHHTLLETVWTIIPTLVLLFIATPSFALIYALDEVVEPQLTVRIIGRQWYWTYEYPDTVAVSIPAMAETKSIAANLLDSVVVSSNSQAEKLSAQTLIAPKLSFLTPGFAFNSYLIPTEDLFVGSFRLLEVTRRMVLPVLTNVRILVSSYDVIHSWAVPSFGVKVDALPGRLNEYFLNIHYLGVFYGQCSEICGVNHGFMPIKVEVTTVSLFSWWCLESSLGENAPLKFLNAWALKPVYADVTKQIREFSPKVLGYFSLFSGVRKAF